MAQSKFQRLPFLTDGTADPSAVCEVGARTRRPTMTLDEPVYRCTDMVEDLVSQLATESDRRILKVVDSASADLATELGDVATRSDRHLDQMTELFRSAGLVDNNTGGSLDSVFPRSRWRDQKTGSAVAESAVLALIGALIVEPPSEGGIDGETWRKHCEERLDTESFARASGLAATDISRAVETTAHALARSVSEQGEVPLVLRDRWVRVAAGKDRFRVRHLVPGVAVFGATESDAYTTIVPVGPSVSFENLAETLEVSLSVGDGEHVAGILRFPLESDNVLDTAHAVKCRVVGHPEASGVDVRLGEVGSLWNGMSLSTCRSCSTVRPWDPMTCRSRSTLSSEDTPHGAS